MWILQEVAFTKNATIICGPDCTSWSELDPAIGDELARVLGKEYYTLIRIWQCRQPNSLAITLLRTHESKSSEPRDKVYAVLGLITQQERLLDGFPVQIDYNIPVVDLYTNVTRWCMSRTPALFPYFLEMASTPTSIENLPSWAIDWSRSWKDRLQAMWTMLSDWNQDFAGLFTPGYGLDKLPLSGVQFDTVDIAGVAPAWNFASTASCESTLFETLQDWQNLADKVVLGRENLVETFFHTLVAYDLEKSVGKTLQKVGFQKLCEQLGLYKLDAKCHTAQDVSEAYKVLSPYVDSRVNLQIHGKRMCSTSSGRLCLCPERTEKGDVIVGLEILEPFSARHVQWRDNACCVLRKQGAYYSLVGRCFVYGGVQGYGPTDLFVLV